jgi:ribosomal-protein-serine acetyltransferase
MPAVLVNVFERARNPAVPAGPGLANPFAAGRAGRHPGPMTQPPETLSHGQVILRRWRPGDAAALLAAVVESKEHLRPWMPWAEGYDEARAAEYLSDCDEQWTAGTGFAYAITVGDHLVGSAGLLGRAGDGGLEIGYWVHSDWTGRGIATDAAAALTEAALALPGIDRVEIYHDAANAASGRIPAKLGYARIGARPTRDLAPAAPADTGTDVLWRLTR